MGKFKVGDVVIIAPPEDHMTPPGFNNRMQQVLEDNNFKMVLGMNVNKDKGYWYCKTDPGTWTWPEGWMRKVNRFKGNIK